jgi:hypothetical protein
MVFRPCRTLPALQPRTCQKKISSMVSSQLRLIADTFAVMADAVGLLVPAVLAA